jgi:hypothetical protein
MIKPAYVELKLLKTVWIRTHRFSLISWYKGKDKLIDMYYFLN